MIANEDTDDEGFVCFKLAGGAYYQSAWLFPSIIAIGGAATTCEAHVRDLREKKKSGHVFDRIATRDVLDERDAHVDEVAQILDSRRRRAHS